MMSIGYENVIRKFSCQTLNCEKLLNLVFRIIFSRFWTQNIFEAPKIFSNHPKIYYNCKNHHYLSLPNVWPTTRIKLAILVPKFHRININWMATIVNGTIRDRNCFYQWIFIAQNSFCGDKWWHELHDWDLAKNIFSCGEQKIMNWNKFWIKSMKARRREWGHYCEKE
jgi:hypothetical protein